MDFKPKGYNSVSPYLIVDGVDRLIKMLEEAFDAEVIRMFKSPDGLVMHGEVRIDDSIIMLSDASEEYPSNQTILHLYVPDVDSTYERAIKAGFVEEQMPVKKDDPDKRGSVKDFSGNWWSLSTQID